jgi:MFS family permease
MRQILKSAWPLFAGLILMMTGNGLQITLLGVRATLEGFDAAAVGIIMSCYYGGYLAGSLLTPPLVARVGHIRVFAAMAAIASAGCLLYGLFVHPAAWALIRALAGFSFASLYIVIESWMNDISTAETRGKVMAAYLVACYGAMMGGQYLLNLAPARSLDPFIYAAIFVSFALVPVALSRRPAPEFQVSSRIGLRELWRASPLGVFSISLCGIASSLLFSIGPVYATRSGMDLGEVANFMACFIFGGMAGQIPLGMLSDRIGRRATIILNAALAIAATLLCWAFAASWLIYPLIALTGGLALSMYPLSSAYINDRLRRDQIVSAGGAIILVYGAACIFGPLSGSLVMDYLGNAAIFPELALVYAVILVFALYRSTQTAPLPMAEQEQYTVALPEAPPIAQEDTPQAA